jgi:hypothetical protein
MALKGRIKLIDPDEATGKVLQIFEDILHVRGGESEEKGLAGGINALWRMYANAPQVLERNWFGNAKVMRTGNVSHKMKQSIAMVVAQTWGCEA